MRRTIAVILGGGKGTRLDPLTRFRSKPAVPLAGRYRLIDVPISNCINSGLRQMYILTQFNSVSLHRHIRRTYNFDSFSRGFVEILAAQQTNQWRNDWYQGTADAVRKNLRYFDQDGVELVLILSGDQLYRMDYRRLIETHQQSGADATIAAVAVPAELASLFGLLQLDPSDRVTGFVEKPQTEHEVAPLTHPSPVSEGRVCLGNMGVYLFNRRTLVELLEGGDADDFGHEVFPRSIGTHHVQCHRFDGYWEDVGTIRSYYEANLALARADAPFNLSSRDFPIYTEARFLPPARFEGASIRDSLIADGCVIGPGVLIENSVIGPGCTIGPDVIVRDSILLGNDLPQESFTESIHAAPEQPVEAVGRGSELTCCIVDRNCTIGVNARLAPPAGPDATIGPVELRDGVLVVPKNVALPDGWDCESALIGQQPAQPVQRPRSPHAAASAAVPPP